MFHPSGVCTRTAACWLILVLAVGWGVTNEALAKSKPKFFKPPKASAVQLDPKGIYPLGQQFGFGFYSISGNSKADPRLSNMARVAQNGFTLAGPYYGDNWSDFSPIYSAANENLKFIFQIRPPASLSGVSIGDRPTALASLSDAEIAASVREQVAAVLSDPIARDTVARWSLGVEEVRYWYAPELRYLKIASETVRAVEKQFNAPHEPFSMYEPENRDAAALKKTGKYQDIVSKGTYLTSYARGPEREGHAIWSYSQIVSAAKSLKTLPQAVLQLSQDFTDPKTGNNAEEIRRVIRNDAYLGLVMGIKSFDVWSMYENRPNLTTHNEQFQAYASVAQDLTGDLDLQKVFLFGEARSDLKIKTTSSLKQFQYVDDSGKKYKYDTLHTFDAEVGSDRYLFLVNSTEQPMDVSIGGLPSSFLMDDLFAGTTTDVHQTSITQHLDVLGVTALRFRDPSLATLGSASSRLGIQNIPEPATVTLALVAGGCVWNPVRRRRNRRRAYLSVSLTTIVHR